MVGGRNLKLLTALKTKQFDSSQVLSACLHVSGWICAECYSAYVSSINSALIFFFFFSFSESNASLANSENQLLNGRKGME